MKTKIGHEHAPDYWLFGFITGVMVFWLITSFN